MSAAVQAAAHAYQARPAFGSPTEDPALSGPARDSTAAAAPVAAEAAPVVSTSVSESSSAASVFEPGAAAAFLAPPVPARGPFLVAAYARTISPRGAAGVYGSYQPFARAVASLPLLTQPYGSRFTWRAESTPAVRGSRCNSRNEALAYWSEFHGDATPPFFP